MIDILAGTIVDLLESPEEEAVVDWLKKFPQIKIISRDGSRTDAAAIREAHPKAIQVTDRFHLIALLYEIAQTLMCQFFQPRIPIEITDKKYEEFEDFLLYASQLDKILYVKKLQTVGMTKQGIRIKTGFSLHTILRDTLNRRPLL